jgi:mono/diheme cytochrome c family protein
MRREPLDFSGNGCVIDFETEHGLMSRAGISNTTHGRKIMFGLVRYSLTIAASICAAILAGERAFGQPPTYGVAQVVPIPTGARPQVPARRTRVIREAPNGDLFVADTMFGAVHVLRAPPGSTRPIRDEVFAGGLTQPFDIAFYPLGSNPRWVYIANSDGVVRFRYRNGDLKATGQPEQIVAGIPTSHHDARDIAFSADGHPLFFSMGSASIVTEDGIGREPVQAGYVGAKGRDLYIANCSACHQANGEGLPGVFPPLQGSGVVNKDDAARHIQVVLNGMQNARAGGVVYAAAMPPFAGTLSDAEIADIIDYERSSWGNHGIPVTAAQVAAERAGAK